MTNNDFVEFVDSYIKCALWSSVDDNEEPMDKNFCRDDLAPETLRQIMSDCSDFVDDCEFRIDLDSGQAGHDFWLTRNGHGAGFWDGDWGADGIVLTEYCKKFNEVFVYVGDDGKIYFE